MRGWLRSGDSGPLIWMRLCGTSTVWRKPPQRSRRRGENDDRLCVHARSRERGANKKRRREVDADSGQGTAPLAGEGLGSDDGPGAAARVGSVRDGWEPGDGGGDREAHLDG